VADPKKPRSTPSPLTSKALVRIIRAAERRPRTTEEAPVKPERAVVPVEVLAGRVRHAPRGRFVTGGRVEFAGQTKAVATQEKAEPATGDVAVKRVESSPVQEGSQVAERVVASKRARKSEGEVSAEAMGARRTVKRTSSKVAGTGAEATSPARKSAVRKATAKKTATDATPSKKATVRKTTAKRAAGDKKVGKSSGATRGEKGAAKVGGKRAQSGVKSPAQGLKPKRK
ncbi:MAG: hypothetical protein IJC63_05540, partial [Myxococcaceae bacterium]|nr:hypothetical protein [Myxococcaceae bacterium]